ncbi:glycosyltransferase family 4 protein [Winogradskyella litorisediminis]|uniref:Glycosyltransferase family 4 protein n=1 Tax=Winogradskyella litorisediminis TaxID=1156618 RepID=A0ABW3NCB0_9FLAO
MKVNLFFEHFPAFNQSYISDMVELLNDESSVDLEVNCLKKSDYNSKVNVKVAPKYFSKRLYERFNGFFAKSYKDLSYWEIKWLKEKLEVVHLHHSFLFKYFKGISEIEATKRPKLVVTLRGSDTYLRPWFDQRWVDFYKHYSKGIDAFVVMSNHQKTYLQKWGVSDDKIHIIPASIKTKNSKPKHLNSEKIRIVSSFRMTWEKNIEGNLRVVKYLIEEGYDVQYDIYGRGNDVSEAYFMVDKYNLHEVVTIKGKVENDVYINQLGEYDFYLQLSKSESLSISTIEAQSLGLPAIISDSGGMPETILDGVSGFAIPFSEPELASKQIIKLINNKELYAQFSEAGIKNVNKKLINQIEVKAYLDLYKNLF